jgi:hypothetical protein
MSVDLTAHLFLIDAHWASRATLAPHPTPGLPEFGMSD